MLRRHLRLARAVTAAGLLSLMIPPSSFGFGGDPADQTPAAEAQAGTVKILDGKKSGDLGVEVRGAGQAQVKLAIKNNTARRLNVILPPGLVAASATAQGAGGGGIQSMGLGAPGNRLGAFGQFGPANAANAPGLRSVNLAAETNPNLVTVPAGKTLDVAIPAVCLNYGVPSPSGKDKLTLVDVDDYSRDVRVRRALRTLATLGTSQGTAQAVMWNVCNGVSFTTMLAEGERVVNRHETAIAARFLEALDGPSSDEIVDPNYLTEARVFVTVLGGEGLEKDARRLASEMEGLRVLGLPIRASLANALPKATAPALHMVVNLTSSKVGLTTADVTLRYASGVGSQAEWTALGKTSFRETSAASALKGADLAKALDHGVAAAFVQVKTIRKTTGSTTLRIENGLPFSLSSVTIRAGSSPGAATVNFAGLGIGPVRSATATLQAPSGSIDRVELNGL